MHSYTGVFKVHKLYACEEAWQIGITTLKRQPFFVLIVDYFKLEPVSLIFIQS